MNSKALFIVALACGVAVGATADELVLKEGKTLQGRITHEDDEEYTIRLGKMMVLRVPKESVVEVRRDKPKESSSPTLRLIQPPKPVAASTTSVAVMNPKKDYGHQQREVKHFSITESVVSKDLPVNGAEPKLEVPTASWVVAWTGGETKTEEGQKKWKSGVIQATVTVTVPSWKTGASAKPEAIAAWNRFGTEIGSRNEGQIRLYSESLDNFAEALSQLQSASEASLAAESKTLFEEMKDQAARRQQGFLRRRKKPV